MQARRPHAVPKTDWVRGVYFKRPGSQSENAGT